MSFSFLRLRYISEKLLNRYEQTALYCNTGVYKIFKMLIIDQQSKHP